jgi:predicted nucleic acid binding AN1-type Zn finger protein
MRFKKFQHTKKRNRAKPIIKQENTKMEETIQPESQKTDTGNPGEDFCQVCGGNTKFIGGCDYETENYECRSCGALHIMKVLYTRGVRTSSHLESIM